MEIKNDKELYESPAVNVLELKPEGLICLSFESDELPGFEFSTMSATPLSGELSDLEVIY